MTDRQGRFVEAYLDGPCGVRFNATRAAEAAGYRWPSRQGPRLTTFPAVAAAIRAGEDRRARERRKRAAEHARAAAARAWRSLPRWYREGLPRPQGTRGRYRRRRCM